MTPNRLTQHVTNTIQLQREEGEEEESQLHKWAGKRTMVQVRGRNPLSASRAAVVSKDCCCCVLEETLQEHLLRVLESDADDADTKEKIPCRREERTMKCSKPQ